jgi:hypothetical protein
MNTWSVYKPYHYWCWPATNLSSVSEIYLQKDVLLSNLIYDSQNIDYEWKIDI